MTERTQAVAWDPGGSPLTRLSRMGVMRGRLLLNRALGRPFSVRVRLLEQDVELAIDAGRELRRAADFALESALVQRMLQHLQPGDTVFDIGANIGLITLALAGHGNGRECSFHCFEPEPRNFGQLVKNLAVNGLASRASGHRMALGDREGEAELFVRGGAGEGRHSMASRGGSTGSIRVPLMSAAAFAAGQGCRADVVKIDVEGAEGYVLAGFEPLFATAPPRDIFMEVHPKGLRDLMPDGPTIPHWLSSHGYRLIWEQPRRSGVHRHYRLGGNVIA